MSVSSQVLYFHYLTVILVAGMWQCGFWYRMWGQLSISLYLLPFM